MTVAADALLAALLVAAAPAEDKALAYSAEMVTVSVSPSYTSRSFVWSDGVHVKSLSEDGESGVYSDSQKKLHWQWTRAKGCVPMFATEAPSSPPPGPPPKRTEEIVGRETVDGHPTQKVKITTTVQEKAGTSRAVAYVWRATDLRDLPIRTENADGSYRTELRHVVLGTPDPLKMASPCGGDAVQANARPVAPAGGYRTIPFFEAGCQQFVPLPLEMTIPSDYAIRDGRPRGCFWGAGEDLDRVLTAPSEVDLTGIRRGVYWCRSSEDTEYDPVHRKFVNAAGPQENWPAAFAAEGIKDLAITPKSVGGIATLRVSGTLNGKHVYMLYLGFGDSPAVLISYTPPGAGGKGDAAEWARFLESLRAAAQAPAR